LVIQDFIFIQNSLSYRCRWKQLTYIINSNITLHSLLWNKIYISKSRFYESQSLLLFNTWERRSSRIYCIILFFRSEKGIPELSLLSMSIRKGRESKFLLPEQTLAMQSPKIFPLSDVRSCMIWSFVNTLSVFPPSFSTTAYTLITLTELRSRLGMMYM